VQALVGRWTWHGAAPWCAPADPLPPSEAVAVPWGTRPARLGPPRTPYDSPPLLLQPEVLSQRATLPPVPM
jgi:hypothetical protein